MKKFIFSLVLICTICLQANAQEYKDAIIVKNGINTKVDLLKINQVDNTYSFTNEEGELINGSLSDLSEVYEKKGTQWLPGMLGGLGGSILGSMLFKKEGETWWHGAGPSILVGTATGALVGLLFPKYKKVEVGNTTSLSFNGAGIKFEF